MSTIGFVGANERSLTHSSFHQMPRWPSHPISCLASVYTLEGTLAKFSLRSFQKSSFWSTVSPELRKLFRVRHGTTQALDKFPAFFCED